MAIIAFIISVPILFNCRSLHSLEWRSAGLVFSASFLLGTLGAICLPIVERIMVPSFAPLKSGVPFGNLLVACICGLATWHQFWLYSCALLLRRIWRTHCTNGLILVVYFVASGMVLSERFLEVFINKSFPVLLFSPAEVLFALIWALTWAREPHALQPLIISRLFASVCLSGVWFASLICWPQIDSQVVHVMAIASVVILLRSSRGLNWVECPSPVRPENPIEERLQRLRITTSTGSVAVVLSAYIAFRLILPSGVLLNRAAWKASHWEHGQPAAPTGPRVGYSGSRIDVRSDPVVGWYTQEITIPGLLEVDEAGLQRFDPQTKPDARLLILGGSSAFSFYTSTIDRTYFVRLGQILESDGLPVEIVNAATTGWVSAQEVSALETNGVALAPDVVIFLNGLNDLVIYDERSFSVRISTYLDNMQRALRFNRKHGYKTVFVLQPSLLTKRSKSRWEERILDLSISPRRDLEDKLRLSYREMEEGLRRIADADETAFCIPSSGVFDDSPHTVFSDFWHFGNSGHEMLARHIARSLSPIVDAAKNDRRNGID